MKTIALLLMAVVADNTLPPTPENTLPPTCNITSNDVL